MTSTTILALSRYEAGIFLLDSKEYKKICTFPRDFSPVDKFIMDSRYIVFSNDSSTCFIDMLNGSNAQLPKDINKLTLYHDIDINKYYIGLVEDKKLKKDKRFCYIDLGSRSDINYEHELNSWYISDPTNFRTSYKRYRLPFVRLDSIPVVDKILDCDARKINSLLQTSFIERKTRGTFSGILEYRYPKLYKTWMASIGNNKIVLIADEFGSNYHSNTYASSNGNTIEYVTTPYCISNVELCILIPPFQSNVDKVLLNLVMFLPIVVLNYIVLQYVYDSTLKHPLRMERIDNKGPT